MEEIKLSADEELLLRLNPKGGADQLWHRLRKKSKKKAESKGEEKKAE
jgi:hypothetical protein